jgi:hypothetical protein
VEQRKLLEVWQQQPEHIDHDQPRQQAQQQSGKKGGLVFERRRP